MLEIGNSKRQYSGGELSLEDFKKKLTPNQLKLAGSKWREFLNRNIGMHISKRYARETKIAICESIMLGEF